MINLDSYNLTEFCRDVRSLWDWGVTENIGIWYIARNVKPKKFIQVISEQELMAIFSIYNDMKEAEIFITIQSQGIPLNYNGEKTLTQEGNIDMIDDNIVGIGEGIGEGVDEGVGEGAGEGAGEDIGGAIGESVGQVAEEAVDEDIGENIGEAFGEDVGQVAKEPVDESDAMLSEDSFHSLKTDDSDLEDNMDHIGTFSYDVNNPIMEVGAKYSNVGSFRDALTHFALLNEFEYNLQKSDLLRVTATCAKSNCKWRIHASRLQDSLVFQIKTLQGEHTCTSANRCRNKVATQSWVCNRVIEWLRLEGDLSTTELRKRLQQKYHCDYLTNNISESFNAWISNDRHRPLIDMLNTIRQKIMVKMEDRRNRARKWDHEIVPTILKYVNNISKILH
uniref:Transposase MuDR plant domain-containing protein n=1 Tax=Ananas comosus var. bracteatus TaxID=296719 RepID=A0A6V7NTF3_ANACO|nr:unnamed protein product [Ananas comosus var. bracteatus]